MEGFPTADGDRQRSEQKTGLSAQQARQAASGIPTIHVERPGFAPVNVESRTAVTTSITVQDPLYHGQVTALSAKCAP